MAELKSKDLTTAGMDEQSLTITDMTGTSESKGLPVANYSANATVAGNIAMISTDENSDVVASYSQIQQDLMNGDTASTLDRLALLKANDIAAAQDALVNVLSSPDVEDSVKEELTSGFIQLGTSDVTDRNSIANSVSFAALEKESYGEGQEAESIRLNTAEIMDELNASKARLHTVANSYNFAIDNVTLKTGLDVAGLFAPLEEQGSLAQIVADIDNLESMSNWEKFKLWSKTALFVGEAKVQIREELQKLPPEERMQMTRMIADSINNSTTISINGENELRRMITASELLETGGYDNFDRWVDNIFGMLEIVGVGASIRGAIKARKAEKLLETVRDSDVVIEAMYKEASIASDAKAGSYAENVKDTNPAEARTAHANAITDKSGEVALATHGVDRKSVSIKDNMPDVAVSDGAVRSKLRNIDSIEEIMDTSIRSDVLAEMQKTGNIDKYEKEINSAISNVVQDFSNAAGVLPHKSQSTIGLGKKAAVKAERFDDTTDVMITATYTPEKAFNNVDDLENTVRSLLTKYDLGDDIVVTRKLSDGTYKETSIKELRAIEEIAKASGGKLKPIDDYQIKVKYKYSPIARDVTSWHVPEVKRSLMGAGKVAAETFFDAASKFDKEIVQAVGAIDKRIAKIAGTLFEPVQKALKKANFNQQEVKMINDYLNNAYVEKKAFKPAELRKAGYTEKQIEYIGAHRQAFNEIYTLRNASLTKKLSNEGWKKFVDEANETRLIARETNVSDMQNLTYYNQATDEFVNLTKTQIDEMLEAGMRFAETSTPIIKGDESAELVVLNKGDFLSDIKQTDRVLNYSHGYYDTKYTGAWFVDEVRTLANGKQVKKAVGNYEDLAAAKAASQRFTNSAGSETVEYFFRAAKERETGRDAVNMLQAQGKSRWSMARGKLLDNGHGIELEQTKHLKHPVEVLMSSIETTAREIGGTEMLNTMKMRLFENSKEWFPPLDPNDLSKGRRMPNSLDEIKNWGGIDEDPKAINDAKEMFNYIDVVENGWTNTLNEVSSAALEGLARLAGSKGYGETEKALRKASEVSAQGAAKSLVFETMIASNPIRFIAMNAHQATQLTAIEPVYVLKQGLLRDMIGVKMVKIAGIENAKVLKLAAKAAGKTEQEMKDLYNAVIKSGIYQGASNNTIAKASMSNLAQSTNPVIRGYGKVSQTVRRFGFDAGENVNQLSSFLTHYHRAVKAGENPRDLRTIEKITGAAENFTYNMNTRASDLGYTHGSLGVLLQFQNVIHKAMLTMTTNRGLTRAERARLLAFNASMYSLPPAAMYEWFGEYLPEDRDQRDAIVQGLEFYMLNKLVRLAMDEEDVRLDFGNFSPVSLGNFEIINALINEKTLKDALAESPAGSLFFGNNPRLTNAAKSVAMLFTPTDDGQFETADNLKHVAIEFGRVFSGISNALKARAIFETGRIENAVGNRTLSDNGSAATALARVWGIQSMDEIEQYYVGTSVQEIKKQNKEAAQEVYKELVNYNTNIGVKFDSPQGFAKGVSYAYTAYGREVGDLVQEMYKRDLRNKNFDSYNSVLSISGLENGDPDKLRALANIIEDDQKREGFLNMLDAAEKYKDEEMK